MALAKCKECGRDIAKSASACPGCGAPRKRTGIGVKIILGFMAFMVIMSVIGNISDKVSKRNEDAHQGKLRELTEQRLARENDRLASLTPEQRKIEEDRQAAEAAKKAAAQAEVAKRREEERVLAEQQTARAQGLIWNYQDYDDTLTGKKILTAWVKSQNTISLDFPYQGAQRAQLQLRKHPKYGMDVFLQIERGQFVCGIDDCTVSVRFDDGGVQQFAVTEPSDHSTETLFIQNYSRFVSQVRKAKKIVISATMYQEGERAFEFDVSGLDWS